MSYSINKTNITLTRGDTLRAKITITNSLGEPYIPKETDNIRFAMKKRYEDPEPLILKSIPNDTLILILDSEDTKSLPFGKYFYDVSLTTESGEVETFITKANILIEEEAH